MLQVLRARQRVEGPVAARAAVDALRHERVPEHVAEDLGEQRLLREPAVDLGGDDDWVLRHDKGVLGNRLAHLAHRDAPGERAAVIHDRLELAVVDVHCSCVSRASCRCDSHSRSTLRQPQSSARM